MNKLLKVLGKAHPALELLPVVVNLFKKDKKEEAKKKGVEAGKVMIDGLINAPITSGLGITSGVASFAITAEQLQSMFPVLSVEAATGVQGLLMVISFLLITWNKRKEEKEEIKEVPVIESEPDASKE